MKSRFSIGEMSKLHNVPIKTLRYYDEIDLFKPDYVNPESGYRYYSYKQFESLNTIRYLRYLEIPIKEIHAYMQVRGKSEYLTLLNKEKGIIQEKMEVLKQIERNIDRQIDEVESTYEIKVLEEVVVKELSERSMVVLDEKIDTVVDLELSLHKLKNTLGKPYPVVIGIVGLIMGEEKLKANDFGSYSGVCILADERDLAGHVKTLPAGKFACMVFRDHDHSRSTYYYELICRYIQDNGYTICGDAIERVIINEYKSNNPEEYLTEIQIPIRS